MSAGGPIVDPKGDMILLTPNNAHNLTSKSIVLSGDDEIEIEILSRREQNDEMACVSYDGDTTAELGCGRPFCYFKGSQSYKDLQASPEKLFGDTPQKDGKLFITQIRIVIMNSYK